MATNKPFYALVIPAEAEAQDKPPPGHRPPGQGVPPGHMPDWQPGHPSHPIYIEPPEPPPQPPPGSKLVLAWDGESWQWAIVASGEVPPQPTPKR